ncbi:MAG: hypothetical protein NTU54_02355 [Candidatus Omnitrophica bacterium]|nr:hypothetical protein [Candidatus Omnitrophota bacterium]
MRSKAILESIKRKLVAIYPDKILDIKINYKFIKTEGIKSPEADMYLRCRNGNLIFIELESMQPHPDTNFVKYWRWGEKYRIGNRIILLQIFGPMFNNENYIARVRNIKFLRNKISLRNFKYYPINCLVDRFSEAEFKRFSADVRKCLFNSITAIFNRVV